ncbi:MAG: hypothetical protein WCK88_02570 [bacterium]
MNRIRNKITQNINNNRKVFNITLGVCLLGIVFGFIYWEITQRYIYTDNAVVSAPVINLSPQISGVLETVSVNIGEHVLSNSIVARVGSELVKTKVDGIITNTKNTVGELFNRGETVVSMFDPTEMRVVGSIEEDKGLQDIKVGQKAIFTVDAF